MVVLYGPTMVEVIRALYQSVSGNTHLMEFKNEYFQSALLPLQICTQ